MRTIDIVDEVADDVMLTIDANRARVGNYQYLYEKVEDPAILAEDHLLPAIHVIPFAEGMDTISPTIGTGIDHHEFAVSIMGTYDGEGSENPLRMIREYGYACADLFKGNGSRVGRGYIYKINIRFGQYVIVDRVLQQFFITLHVRAFDDGSS